LLKQIIEVAQNEKKKNRQKYSNHFSPKIRTLSMKLIKPDPAWSLEVKSYRSCQVLLRSHISFSQRGRFEQGPMTSLAGPPFIEAGGFSG
jgi:hypothetical protein